MEDAIPNNSDHQLILIVIKAGTTTDSEYDMAPTDILDLNMMSHLALTYPAFLTFFSTSNKTKRIVGFDNFPGANHIFKDICAKFQDTWPIFQIPGVFQDQHQIQGLF